jgi:beta-galactosidase/beta-glucuronidase
MPVLKTPWTDSLDPERPLPEHPRPSLLREDWMSLNGLWDCEVQPIGPAPAVFERRIVVPFPLESALSGIGRPLGSGESLWYRRSFAVPPSWSGRRVILHFGAVDWGARVWVNGFLVGLHRGGYSPFSFDITDKLQGRGGSEELLVEARDPTDAGVQCRGKQIRNPEGIWYTASSGIWRTVWLEAVPESRIVRVVASVAPGSAVEEGRLIVRAMLSPPRFGVGKHRLRVSARAGGKTVAEAETGAEGDVASVELKIPDPRPWSPESPTLYELSLELDGVDRAESYAALRTVALGADAQGRNRILLNGRPYFNVAVLDQGYWPDGLYTAPTDEALASDIELAKRLGFNTIRKHAKVESERWYAHCDRLGMLVWQDIPSGGSPLRFLFSAILGFAGARLNDKRFLGRFGRESAEGREEFELEADEIVDALEGFPCIVAWVPFNEGWGQFESARMARKLASRDHSRLVDAASGWYDRGAGDFASRHDYSRRPRMPRTIGGRAAALTEFGGLTLKVAGHSTEDKRQFGYVGASSGENLAARYEALLDRLADLAREGLAASVYTQITDVEIERNGLVTYDRRIVKADEARIRAANLALARAITENDP